MNLATIIHSNRVSDNISYPKLLYDLNINKIIAEEKITCWVLAIQVLPGMAVYHDQKCYEGLIEYNSNISSIKYFGLPLELSEQIVTACDIRNAISLDTYKYIKRANIKSGIVHTGNEMHIIAIKT